MFNRRSSVTWGQATAFLAVFTLIGCALYFAWTLGLVRPDVVEQGTVSALDASGRSREGATRRVRINGGLRGATYWQVELPDHRWVDCGSSCATVLAEALKTRL